jgi:hypothetical protein
MFGTMTNNRGRAVHRLLRIIPLVVLVAACDDPYGPRFWNAVPVEVPVYSVSRLEYTGLPSAIDLVMDPVRSLPIEIPGATGNWDFLLADRQGGEGLVLVPAAELDNQSRSRIAVLRNVDFLDVREAPRDTALYSAGAVPLEEGVVYVFRSRRSPCGFTTGFRYAKALPVNVDVVNGTAVLAIVRNPYCDDRSFVPPDVN